MLRKTLAGLSLILILVLVLTPGCSPQTQKPPAAPPAPPPTVATPPPAPAASAATVPHVSPVPAATNVQANQGKPLAEVMSEVRRLQEAGLFHEAFNLGLEALPSYEGDENAIELQKTIKRLRQWKADLAIIREAIQNLSSASIREVRTAQRDLFGSPEPASILVRNAIIKGTLVDQGLVMALRTLKQLGKLTEATPFVELWLKAPAGDLRTAFQDALRVAILNGDATLLKTVMARLAADQQQQQPDLAGLLLSVPSAKIETMLGSLKEVSALLRKYLAQALINDDPSVVQWIDSAFRPSLNGKTVLLRQDTTTQGDWKGVYGKLGSLVIGDKEVLPPGLGIKPANIRPQVWDDNPKLVRALQRTEANRIAACWNASQPVTIDLTWTEPANLQISVYCLDWDSPNGGRHFALEWLDPVNNQVVAQQEVSGCQEGVYVVWAVSAPARLRLRPIKPSATVSGLFFDALASNSLNITDEVWLALMKDARQEVQAVLDTRQAGKILGSQDQATVLRGQRLLLANPELARTRIPAEIKAGTLTGQGLVAGLEVLQSLGVPVDASALFAPMAKAKDGNERESYLSVIRTALLAGEVNTVTEALKTVFADKGLVQLDLLGGLLGVPGPVLTQALRAEGNRFQDLLAAIYGSQDARLVGWRRTAVRATFLGTDLRMQGAWRGLSGKTGHLVVGDGSQWPPEVTLIPASKTDTVWQTTATEDRAVQKAAGQERVAAAWTGNGMVIDLRLPDTRPRRLGLYCLDWNSKNQWRQTIEILDPSGNEVLDRRELRGFAEGIHLAWTIRGSIRLRFTNNGCVSAFFLDDLPATADHWWPLLLGLAGLQASRPEEVAAAQEQLARLPQAAELVLQEILSGRLSGNSLVAGLAVLTRLGCPADKVSALLEPMARIEAPEIRAAFMPVLRSALMASDAGVIRQVATRVGRDQDFKQVDLLGALTTAPGSRVAQVLAAEFEPIRIQVNRIMASADNRVIAWRRGALRATFLGIDGRTQGNWKNVYGKTGSVVIGDQNRLPASCQLVPWNHQEALWAPSSKDLRAPQKQAGEDRLAAAWHGNGMQLDLRVPDSHVRQLTIYCLDWDQNNQRRQTIEVLDPISGEVLDRREIGNFSDGIHLGWLVRGSVRLRLSGKNPVVSGLFVDDLPATSDAGWSRLLAQAALQSSRPDEVQNALLELRRHPQAVRSILQEIPNLKGPALAAGLAALKNLGCPDGTTLIAAFVACTDPQLRNDYIGAIRAATAAGEAETIRQVVNRLRDDRENKLVELLDPLLNAPFPSIEKALGQEAIGQIKPILLRAYGSTEPRIINWLRGSLRLDFLGTDSSTQGLWKGVYGRNGQLVVGDKEKLPAGAAIKPVGQQTQVLGPSQEYRAMQRLESEERLAAAWTGNPFLVDIVLPDASPRRLTIYCCEWEGKNRRHVVEVLDASRDLVLDRREVADFQNGIHLSWQVRGSVRMRFSKNGMVSGFFLDDLPATADAAWARLLEQAINESRKDNARFLAQDAKTKGTWKGVYGRIGCQIAGDRDKLPKGVSSKISGITLQTWEAVSKDERSLQKQEGADRIAAGWNGSKATYSLDLAWNDQRERQMALYFLDFDRQNRKATIEILDPTTSDVLDRRELPDSREGIYLVWAVTGKITVRVTATAGNAILSGVFWDEMSKK